MVKDGRGKTWHDHLVTLVSRQVLQEVVAQIEKINSCPTGISATNPQVFLYACMLFTSLILQHLIP